MFCLCLYVRCSGLDIPSQLLRRADGPGDAPQHLGPRGGLQDEDDHPGPLQGEAELGRPPAGGHPGHGGGGGQVPRPQPPADRSVVSRTGKDLREV